LNLLVSWYPESPAHLGVSTHAHGRRVRPTRRSDAAAPWPFTLRWKVQGWTGPEEQEQRQRIATAISVLTEILPAEREDAIACSWPSPCFLSGRRYHWRPEPDSDMVKKIGARTNSLFGREFPVPSK
jgi:hypothetical protein